MSSNLPACNTSSYLIGVVAEERACRRFVEIFLIDREWERWNNEGLLLLYLVVLLHHLLVPRDDDGLLLLVDSESSPPCLYCVQNTYVHLLTYMSPPT